MNFTPISINNYVALHLKNNPSQKEEDLRRNLETAIRDYENNVKCSCGEDIWVIGSASIGNSCYTCMTGEKLPTENYEIDSVVPYFTEADAFTVDDWGENSLEFLGEGNYRNDDGTIIDPDLYPTPKKCLSCKNFILKSQKVYCTLNKIGQEPGEEFQCGSFDGV